MRNLTVEDFPVEFLNRIRDMIAKKEGSLSGAADLMGVAAVELEQWLAKPTEPEVAAGPRMALKEVARLQRWGTLPPGSDILGTWLVAAMTGRLELVEDETGKLKWQKHPDALDEPFLSCVGEISLRWDQWVRCRIVCTHGVAVAVSDFFNVTEALMRAVVKFNETDHPRMETEEEAGDVVDE